jgi:PAS domain S-box-containing protein
MLIAPHEQFCSISKALENIASGKMPDLQPDAISCYHELIAVAERVQTDQEELERLHLELTREVSASRLLMEREHLYREVFAKSVIAIVIATEDGSILDANSAAEGMLGYRIEELKHFHVADIALPDDHGSDDALIRDLLDGRRLYYNIEKRYVRNDGILLWVMLTTFAVYGGTGTPNLVHMFEDISARKSAEQYLQHVSTHDALTGLHNRAFFDVEFNRFMTKRTLIAEPSETHLKQAAATPLPDGSVQHGPPAMLPSLSLNDGSNLSGIQLVLERATATNFEPFQQTRHRNRPAGNR